MPDAAESRGDRAACPRKFEGSKTMRHPASSTFRLAGAASILTLASLMAASSVQAAPAQSAADALQHFIDCAGWLISDPAQHAANCDPGHDVFVSGSTGFATDPEAR